MASVGDSSDVRLICAADVGSYAWRYATDIEKNTASFTEVSEGLVKYGSVNTQNVYVYEDGWRRGTDLDMTLDFSCIADKAGVMTSKTVKSVTTWYTCDINPTAWREATAIEADTAGFGVPAGDAPIVRIGNVNKSITYVYDNGNWRYGTNLDRKTGLGPCLLADTNVVRHESGTAMSDNWYKCVVNKTEYVENVQLPCVWREATDFEMDTYSLSPTAAIGTDTAGLVNKNLLYVMDSVGWRPATNLEGAGLGACTEAQNGLIAAIDANNKESWYRCTNENIDKVDAFWVKYTWRKATNIEKDTLGWGRNYAEGKFKNGKVNDEMTYVFESNKWRHGTSLDSSLGLACISTRNDLLRASGGIWYKCKGDTAVSVDGATLTSTWRKATALEIDTKYWMENKDSTGKLLLGSKTGTTMVWDNESLREASETEIKLGKACVSYKYGQTDSLANTLKYSCSRLGWSTIGKFYDIRETITYKAVLIGNQTWMAQNLQYTTANSRYYDNKMDNVIKYGLLYTWTDALNVCPSGWHLPTKAEWDTLYAYVGGSNVAGSVLKSQSDWAQHGNGSDAYSFTVVPSGAWMSGTYGGYMGEETYACIWSSTEHNSNKAYTASFDYYSDGVSGAEDKNNACSVRCINDIKF